MVSSRSFSRGTAQNSHTTRAGQGGVPGEVYKLRTEVEDGFSAIEGEIDELVSVLTNGSLLVAGQIRVNFKGPGVIATVDPVDPTQVNVVLNGAQGNVTNAYVAEVDTANMPYGHFGYVVGTNRLALTDASSYPAARASGVYNGIPNSVLRIGVLDTVKFSFACPMPSVGDVIFLARADDEVNGGAAGKVTTIPPSHSFLCPVGQIISVSAAQFLQSRTAKCLIHIYGVHKLA